MLVEDNAYSSVIIHGLLELLPKIELSKLFAKCSSLKWVEKPTVQIMEVKPVYCNYKTAAWKKKPTVQAMEYRIKNLPRFDYHWFRLLVSDKIETNTHSHKMPILPSSIEKNSAELYVSIDFAVLLFFLFTFITLLTVEMIMEVMSSTVRQ